MVEFTLNELLLAALLATERILNDKKYKILGEAEKATEREREEQKIQE